MMSIKPPITAQDVRDFIGSHFMTWEFKEGIDKPNDSDVVTLSIHDLLSAFEWNDDEEVMDMALCESLSCVLRIGQLYRFRPVGDCEKCKAMGDAAIDAYGPELS